MNTPHHDPSHGDQAIEMDKAGYKLVVVRRGSKAPAFKGWQTMEYTHDDLRRLFDGTDYNVGIRTGGNLVVLDIDTQDSEKIEWVREHVGDTPMKVQTPSGGQHWYFGTRAGVEYGNGVKLRGLPYDLRWRGTQAVCPWSQNQDGKYLWLGQIVPVEDLPKFKVSHLRERARRRVQSAIAPEVCEANDIVRRGRGYVDRIDRRAVSGQGGHTALFVAALKIVGFVRKLGGGEHEAWELLLYYNATKCDPPWDVTSERDLAALRHKLDDAVKKQR